MVFTAQSEDTHVIGFMVYTGIMPKKTDDCLHDLCIYIYIYAGGA